MNKVIIDGTLLAECLKLGKNSYGMLRIADEVTKEIVKLNKIDVSFSNSIYDKTNHLLLKSYLEYNFGPEKMNIISEYPTFSPPMNSIRIVSKIYKFAIKSLNPTLRINNIDEYDLFHSYYEPFSEFVQSKKIKKCLTFLDIIPLQLNGYDQKLVSKTKEIVNSIINNYAISISEYSRNELLNFEKRIDPDRVFTVPIAASKTIFYRNENQIEWEKVRKKYDLPENYFLSVSSNDVRKNIPHLIKCFRAFYLQKKPKDLFLVIAGNFNYNRKLLETLNIEKEITERIIFPMKFIDNEDLALIYSKAKVFFFMSVYEGFGLPVLEAMQCGTPVVCSNTTSLPEVIGNAGISISPIDEDALCESMQKLYTDESLRLKFINMGLKRAEKFTWEKTAAGYIEIFNKIQN